MKYKLAKQLKNAGFSQKDTIYSMAYGKQDKTKIYSVIDIYEGGDDIDCIVPTLSELIEACGEEFECVGRNDEFGGGWIATDKKDKWSRGKTPKEAVAKLWLKLNQ